MLADGSLNVSLVAKAIKTIQAGAALGKVVVVGLWPGPLVRFGPDGNPLWPEGSGATPRTPAEWRAALLSRHAFAIAFFLTVAEPLVYMQYMLWYNGFSQGALPCDDQPGTCCAPNSDSWYPDLYKPLGAPLGPAKREGNVWTRAFAHATSTLDLDNPGASGVAFSHLASVSADAGAGAGVDAPARACDDACLIACAEGAPTCMGVWSAPVPDRFTTRFTLQSGVVLSLPTSTFTLAPQSDPLVISITAAPVPTLYLREQKVSVAELERALQDRGVAGRPVVIRADAGTPYEKVVEISNLALKRGFAVALAFQPEVALLGR